MNPSGPIPESAAKEAQAILRATGDNLLQALEVVQKQLDTIYSRAQVLLSLAGIVVTVTGFSGRLIAGSSSPAQAFLVSGLFVVLLSALFVFLRVMRVRWVTSMLADNPDSALANAIFRRNRKTTAYSIGGLILFLGLLLYCISISLMLLNPESIQGPVR